jgi:teichuronic acid biosynthesis glycosyltransferase TuaH
MTSPLDGPLGRGEARGIDLVVMPYHDYRKSEIEGFRGRDNHFLEMLIADAPRFRTILVIDRPVAMIERLALGRSWHVASGRIAQRGPDWRLTQIGPNVYVLNCLSMALVKPVRVGQCWWDDAFASSRLASITQRVFETLELRRPVVLLHHPFGIGLLNRLEYGALLFDIVDNFIALDHFKSIHLQLERHYRVIDARAERIFSVTPAAGAYLFGCSEKVSVLPNGVSPAFIRSAAVRHDLGQLKELSRPVVGYVGSLSSHFDANLLGDVAVALSDHTFVIVGAISSSKDFQRLKSLSNVKFVGAVPYPAVPAVLRDFDVCIAPYVFGHELAQGGESIKLYEYVAANKPVVTTPVPGAERFEGFIRVALDAKTFAAAIRSYTVEGDFSGYPADLLQGLTWRDRFEPLMQAISQAGRS